MTAREGNMGNCYHEQINVNLDFASLNSKDAMVWWCFIHLAFLDLRLANFHIRYCVPNTFVCLFWEPLSMLFGLLWNSIFWFEKTWFTFTKMLLVLKLVHWFIESYFFKNNQCTFTFFWYLHSPSFVQIWIPFT